MDEMKVQQLDHQLAQMKEPKKEKRLVLEMVPKLVLVSVQNWEFLLER